MSGNNVIPALSICLALLVGAIAAEDILSGKSATFRQGKAQRTEMKLIRLINVYRSRHHLGPLRLSNNLTAAAREHSQDMIARSYFDHRGFPARVRRHRAVRFLGENIAWGTDGFGTARGILSLWRSSPPHKALMLNPHFNRIGIGVVFGTFYSTDNAVVTTADFSS